MARHPLADLRFAREQPKHRRLDVRQTLRLFGPSKTFYNYASWRRCLWGGGQNSNSSTVTPIEHWWISIARFLFRQLTITHVAASLCIDHG